MLEKSIAAMLSAIEIYNKPDFKYREETFSILCINSWETLLKSKLLNLASNKITVLYALENKTLKNGQKSKIKRPKKNGLQGGLQGQSLKNKNGLQGQSLKNKNTKYEISLFIAYFYSYFNKMRCNILK
jgi:Domain of unknown function (DUF3644)